MKQNEMIKQKKLSRNYPIQSKDKKITGTKGVMAFSLDSCTCGINGGTIGLLLLRLISSPIGGGIESFISKTIWCALSNDDGKSLNFKDVKWITPNICIHGKCVSLIRTITLSIIKMNSTWL
eukprot:55195_1